MIYYLSIFYLSTDYVDIESTARFLWSVDFCTGSFREAFRDARLVRYKELVHFLHFLQELIH